MQVILATDGGIPILPASEAPFLAPAFIIFPFLVELCFGFHVSNFRTCAAMNFA